jgi:hypothetical protein
MECVMVVGSKWEAEVDLMQNLLFHEKHKENPNEERIELLISYIRHLFHVTHEYVTHRPYEIMLFCSREPE